MMFGVPMVSVLGEWCIVSKERLRDKYTTLPIVRWVFPMSVWQMYMHIYNNPNS